MLQRLPPPRTKPQSSERYISFSRNTPFVPPFASICLHWPPLAPIGPLSRLLFSLWAQKLYFEWDLINRPVALVTNWTNQSQKFFASSDLIVRVWSPEAWKKDEGNQGTVWVVKESLLSQTNTTNARGIERKTPFWEVFSDPDFHKHTLLLSTFADEGHLAWRSDSSTRSKVYKKITSLSKFNVLLSGTMFPLGPGEDARGILEHLGGDFTSSETPVKWSDEYLTAFRRLFGINPQDKKENVWEVLSFRVIVSQFYLRRTIKSFWEGEWVINKTAARPVPRIVLPNPDAFTQLNDPRAQTKTVQQTRETLRNKMKRADQKRFLAWTQVYELIRDEYGESAFTGAQSHRHLETYIKKYVRRYRGSGRITKLIALVKAHVEKGEKFIVVSDRIFLVMLAYHVRSPSLASLILDLR